MNKKSIGVFDSGIGGLTVYKTLKEKMPREKVIYLGDTARLPYGTKSPEAIIKFSEDNALFLLERHIKILVVACNSASSYAVPHLQEKLDIPVLGVIEPGAEAAAKWSKTCIGVIGTSATSSSHASEISRLEKKPGAKIITRDCPLFVPLVEEGWITHEVTRLVAREYLLPLKEKGIDSLVLGCTHYPVLKGIISEVIGENIRLIDSSEVITERVYTMLKSLGWLNDSRIVGSQPDEFFVTDFPERFKRVGEIFLGREIEKVGVAPSP